MCCLNSLARGGPDSIARKTMNATNFCLNLPAYEIQVIIFNLCLRWWLYALWPQVPVLSTGSVPFRSAEP